MVLQHVFVADLPASRDIARRPLPCDGIRACTGLVFWTATKCSAQQQAEERPSEKSQVDKMIQRYL
jgi:hypothetical protein